MGQKKHRDDGDETPAEGSEAAAKRTRVEAAGVLAFTHPECKPSSKIAAFDLDGTLVVPKSGKKFPEGRSDWKWLNGKVCEKLKQAHESGYKVVLITNQAGLTTGKAKEGDITGKITDIFEKIAVPFQAFAASAKDRYRKPSPDIWTVFVEKFNDLAECFYVGDAAGRQDGWAKGKKKDHSCSDRQFAKNVGIGFHTPEEYFLGEKPAPFSWGFDPASVRRDAALHPGAKPAGVPEMVVLVGFPASGKSCLCSRLLPGYARINRDTLKTRERCVKECRERLAEGRSVVVDNLNSTREQRAEYLKLAKAAGVAARCFHLQTSLELALHLNALRERLSGYQEKHVPHMVFYKHRKAPPPPFESSAYPRPLIPPGPQDLQAPTVDEGFSEVVPVDFVPSFKDPEHERAFALFYDA